MTQGVNQYAPINYLLTKIEYNQLSKMNLTINLLAIFGSSPKCQL